jgi:arylsulfatase A-like enzyme
VELIDLMPTLLELAGLEAQPAISGESAVPLLRGASDPARPAFAEKAVDSDPAPGTRDRIGSAAVISPDGRWKLIHNHTRTDGVPEFELYDRRADPLDQRDVSAANPDVVAALREDIQRWRADAQRIALPKAEAAGELSGEEAEHLRALGYAE